MHNPCFPLVTKNIAIVMNDLIHSEQELLNLKERAAQLGKDLLLPAEANFLSETGEAFQNHIFTLIERMVSLPCQSEI